MIIAQAAKDSTKNENKNIFYFHYFFTIPTIGGERVLWQNTENQISVSMAGGGFEKNLNQGTKLPYSAWVFQPYAIFGVHYSNRSKKKNRYLELSTYLATFLDISRAGSLSVEKYKYQQQLLSNGNYQTIFYPDISIFARLPDTLIIEDFTYQYRIWGNVWSTARIGYRYQRDKTGFFARAGLSVFGIFRRGSGIGNYEFSLLPIPDFSIGWSFRDPKRRKKK